MQRPVVRSSLSQRANLLYARGQVYLRNTVTHPLILLLGATIWIASCSPSATPAAARQEQAAQVAQPTQQQYRLTATIQDLMDGIIDPSADTLWDSVAYIASTKGVEDRQPRTDEEWKAVRNSAITLVEAANLLSMPGRSVSAASNSAPGAGELSHAEIQQRINSTHDSFTQFARNLQDAGLKALAAIDAKDAQGLMDAGGTIDEACEACHVTYWYPNQKRQGGS
jgi:cytochrome c556